MGWESNWLGLQVWDVAYGYKMSIIDEARGKKISFNPLLLALTMIFMYS